MVKMPQKHNYVGVRPFMAVSQAGIAANLPYIGIAAGCLGAIVATFKASKDDDANVKTVRRPLTTALTARSFGVALRHTVCWR